MWRERARGATVDARTQALSGLDQLRAITSYPGMYHLTGTRFDSADLRRATFSMPVTGWLLSPQGMVPGGMLAIAADGALGCAIHTALPPGSTYTTAELSLTYLRRIPVGERIVATGHALHVGRTLAFSNCDITDGAGVLLAHATSRCLVFEPSAGTVAGSGTATPPPLSTAGDVNDDDADPFERPPAGVVIDQATWDRCSGLEVLRAQVDGSLPQPPLHHLLGILAIDVDEGRAECVMPVTGWLATPWGWPQGGFLATLADIAIGMAVQTTVPAASTYANVDLKVNYLRPLTASGTLVHARAKVEHRGRSLAVASAEVTDASGRRLALATGSAQILASRPAASGDQQA